MKPEYLGEVNSNIIPGVVVRDGVPYGEVCGHWYPVIGAIKNLDGGYIPVLDIPQMEDIPRLQAANE